MPGGGLKLLYLPAGFDLALFVVPGLKESIVVMRIRDEAGIGTIVVLLSAQLFD